MAVEQYEYGRHPPLVQNRGYDVAHNLLRAHGRAYELYNMKYRDSQNGMFIRFQVYTHASEQMIWDTIQSKCVYKPLGHLNAIVKRFNVKRRKARRKTKLSYTCDQNHHFSVRFKGGDGQENRLY